jgi:mycothiol synthase
VSGVGEPRPARLVAATRLLSPAEVEQVRVLAAAANDADGCEPLSERVRLQVRHGGGHSSVHLLISDGEAPVGTALVGYAYVDATDPVDGPTAELCVHPMCRRRGLGRTLAVRAMTIAAEHDTQARLRLWAHGDHPSATALALSLGFDRTRVLLQLRRSLRTPVPAPSFAPGVRLRAFVPGTDEAAWLALNARAFAEHPEQGRWTAADLADRMAEDWFDPAGFLLAEAPSGALLGFHWTKVHGWPRGSSRGKEPIGEVYVLGVDPAGHGLGLGTALTLAGLRYLRERGLANAMLYVDEANTTAVGLYRRLGFARWTVDVCFQRHQGGPSAGSSSA